MATGKSNITVPKRVTNQPPLAKGEVGRRLRNKLSDAAIQFILDMTVSGYTNDEIRALLKEQFGVSVSEQILYYHRNKHADKLAQSCAQELDTARARSNLTFLSRRIAIADELIKKESKRKRPSLYGIAALISAADTAVHRAEQRRMKYEEIARKYKEGTDDQKSEIMAALERRTQLLQEVDRIEREMLDIVDAEFEVQPPRQLESLKASTPKEVPAEPEDGGLDENELIAK